MTSAELGVQRPDELPKIPLLDQYALAQILEVDDGGVGLLEELMGMFQNDQPERLDKLKEAINSGDLGAIKDLAHAVKGSAGTMGASRLRAAAGILEAYGLGRPVAGSPDGLFELLVYTYEETKLALAEHIESHKTGQGGPSQQ